MLWRAARVLGTDIAAPSGAGAEIAFTISRSGAAPREGCTVEALATRRGRHTRPDRRRRHPRAVEAARPLRRLDGLVNNAGGTSDSLSRLGGIDAGSGQPLSQPPRALSMPSRGNLPQANGAGRIVNIAVGAASIRAAAASAMRRARPLIHLTRCLAVALGPEVTVNCVAPGLMDGTRMTSRLRPEVVAGALQRAVLRRAASVDDVADQVVAFCRSDSVTGQVLNIDAGVFFH